MVERLKMQSESSKKSLFEKLFWVGQVFSAAILGIAAAVGNASVAGLAALDLIGSDAIKKAWQGRKKK